MPDSTPEDKFEKIKANNMMLIVMTAIVELKEEGHTLITVKKVREKTGVSESNMSRVLKMLQPNYITVIDRGHGRSKEIRMTKFGRVSGTTYKFLYGTPLAIESFKDEDIEEIISGLRAVSNGIKDKLRGNS